MRQVAGIIIIAVVSVGLWGCQESGRGVEVIIVGQEEFPEFVVGKWVDQKTGWEFVFRPDGSISTAVYALGRVAIVPGKVTRLPTLGGGKGVFEPGQWTVTYSTEGRELAVTVVMEHLFQDVGDHSIEGSTVDVLAGPVSQDGMTWEPDLLSTGWLVAHVYDGDEYETKEFFNFVEPVDRGKVLFKKVAESE